MFENLRRGRQARNLTTNVPKILVPKSSSEQIFSRTLPLGFPEYLLEPKRIEVISPLELIWVLALLQKLKTKRSHELACQTFPRTSCITESYFSHSKWPLVAVAQSLERLIWSDELQVNWFRPGIIRNNNYFLFLLYLFFIIISFP